MNGRWMYWLRKDIRWFKSPGSAGLTAGVMAADYAVTCFRGEGGKNIDTVLLPQD